MLPDQIDLVPINRKIGLGPAEEMLIAVGGGVSLVSGNQLAEEQKFITASIVVLDDSNLHCPTNPPIERKCLYRY
ncbi:MAG: hypothetical protein WA384_14355 [Rhodomicrobium sp.]